jgi:hypothetical protein
MKKLFSTLLLISTSVILLAQENIYSDSKLKVDFTIEELTDEVNDRFNTYYAFEITNTSQNTVSFIPIFTYKTETGALKSSSSRDENSIIQLSPGEVINGDLTNNRSLTLFQQFLPGNSGKRAANSTYSLESVNIQYQ